jgi:hypothetical protein
MTPTLLADRAAFARWAKLASAALLALTLIGAHRIAGAQTDGFDPEQAALIYHKLSGEPLDFNAIAQRSRAVTRASGFDRPDALKAEIARLQRELDAADPAREFKIRVNDSVSQYDHDRGEFSITLFQPGYFVPIQAFGRQYQIAFANNEAARPIAMPKETAREFDAQLNRIGRSVVNEIRFRIVGQGDPSGAVTGANVVRAEILGARLLDRAGRVVFTPNVVPLAAAAAPGPAGAGDSGAAFDLASADVAGLRVGVKAKDLEATLQRLFGQVARMPAGKNADPRFGGTLAVNDLGCVHVPGRRNNVGPGSVCVTAYYDTGEVVRSVRVERVFPYVDGEVFRKTLVARYGAVAAARNLGSSYSLGWGPEVEQALLYDRSGPRHALTAHYVDNRDFLARSGNALPQIRVVLQLVDAEWAAASKR